MLRSSAKALWHGAKRWTRVPASKPLSIFFENAPLSRSPRYFASYGIDQLKDLRGRSGAPIVECKKALADSDGDMDAAMDWLRKHGAAKASSKVSGREAAEGLVAVQVAPDGSAASIVKVSSETDFAGRSASFIDLVTHVANATLKSSHSGDVDVNDQKSMEYDGKSVQTALEEAIVAIRENLGLASVTKFTSDGDSRFVGYVHGKVDGSIAGSAAAVVEMSGDASKLKEAGKKLAMHIVAAKPEYLRIGDVPEDVVEKEREILTSQVEDTRKPPEVVEKIITGRLKKFYSSVCLLEQEHMLEEGNPKVEAFLKNSGLELKSFKLLVV